MHDSFSYDPNDKFPYYVKVPEAVDKYKRVHGRPPKLIRLALEARPLYGYDFDGIPICYMITWKQGVEVV